MIDDPYSLIVCLDHAQYAKGTLYIDDEISFAYRSGIYLYWNFEFKNNTLRSWLIDPSAMFESKAALDRVRVAGLDFIPKSASLTTGTQTFTLDVKLDDNVVTVDTTPVLMKNDFVLTFNGAFKFMHSLSAIVVMQVLAISYYYFMF